MPDYVLAIDQGTTSSRAILFDDVQNIVAVAQQEFAQHFPHSGWVEHDCEEIWQSVLATVRNVLDKATIGAEEVAAIGITNQRETTVVWDRETGEPVYNAIVWQDRRTSKFCERLKSDGLEKEFGEKTGLLLDPYFSGTKINWLLENLEGVRERAEAGKLAFGTIDSFLIWRLTNGRVHATDATNASRTLCYNIVDGRWDEQLLKALNIPSNLMPEVLDCAAAYGETDPALFGKSIAIRGVAGDQQAATIGQACFGPGMMKSTYGTGCFALLNTGSNLVHSENRLLTTIAYQLGGKVTYALEGSIFVAGAAVQWLRDELKLINAASETEQMASAADPGQEVYLVPAFTGLGAPHWDAEARGSMFGLTRATGPNEFAQAALEAVCYQTRDLLEAMQRDWPGGNEATTLRVDGGMAASNWTMQFLADMLDAPVERPETLETTALGAAWLAGSEAGVWPDQKAFADSWKPATRFDPKMSGSERKRKYAGWCDAVTRTLVATS